MQSPRPVEQSHILSDRLRRQRTEKEILLMTHLVIGYPDFDSGYRLIEGMVDAGVDLMELQIPFSDPMADGPVILHANQQSLAQGATVDRCFEFAEAVAQRFDIPFLFMTYYNILVRHGVGRFVERAQAIGIQGCIVPDLPPEEAEEYLRACSSTGVAPIFIFAPSTPAERLRRIAEYGGGFIYCVARKGVTGADTHFTHDLEAYLARARQATDLPLALGFGVKGRDDVEFLRGKVDIAVIGSQTLRKLDETGVEGALEFIRGLR